MVKAIGIDLGTTNSCVAVMEGGEAVVIPNAEGARTTPSVVAFTKEGERLVGQLAKRQAITNPERTISSIKRKMGTKHRVKIGDKKYAPEEISSMIVTKLRVDAEEYLGEKVKKVVITVPAYFEDSQRKATRDAGKIAGLDVLRIVNEPTAAALAYGIDKEEDQTILVFDLGGGTFDVSILELGEGVFEVKATSGNNLLGGDDFDKKVMDHLSSEFEKENDLDISDDKSSMQRLKEASEKAKIELSGRLTTNINLPYITADESGPKHLDVNLTRAKFDDLTADLVQKTVGPTKRAMRDAKLKSKDIEKVLLVGGSTRIPAVQNVIKKLLKKQPTKGINPDECVAVGAAIQAGILTGEVKDVLLLDVTPLSLGVETLGGVATKLISRNTTIPTRKSQIFSTAVDNQPSVEVHVIQGEREMAKDNKTLGRFHLIGIPPAPRGVPQIEVTFDIDANGIVNVSAKDLGTGKEQKITITASSSLNEGDVDKMVDEAKKYRKRDKKMKEHAELRNQADALVYATEKAIEELSDKLNKQKIRDTKLAIKNVKRSLGGRDLSGIKKAVEELTEISQSLFSEIYDRTGRDFEEEVEEIASRPSMGSDRKKERPKKKGRKPPAREASDFDFELIDEEEKAEAPMQIPCVRCGYKIKVKSRKRPLKIECPKCGKKGSLKTPAPGAGPSKKGKRPPREAPRKRPAKKGEKPVEIPCPRCKTVIEITTTKRPYTLVCPKCGKRGTLK